jgi:hypothetical protein
MNPQTQRLVLPQHAQGPQSLVPVGSTFNASIRDRLLWPNEPAQQRRLRWAPVN